MNFERGNDSAPRPASEERSESIESTPNQKVLEQITNLRKVYRGLNEALNFEIYYLREKLAIYFTRGNEAQGFADAVGLLTEDQCNRINEQLSILALNYVSKATNEDRDSNAFDEMKHADIIVSIFKELPARNEKAMKASVGLNPNE